MLIAESGRVHLHGVVTRDVVHVNSGVREIHLHGVVTKDVVHVNSGVREVLLVGERQCMETRL